LVSQSQSLTFDAYHQDQVVQLMQDQEGSTRTVGLIVNDRPNVSIVKALSVVDRLKGRSKKDVEVAYKKLVAAGDIGHPRLFVGTRHRAAAVALKDRNGRTRLLLSVSASGTPRIEFLDRAGKVVRTIMPETKGEARTWR
jgi:hypothetical protein